MTADSVTVERSPAERRRRLLAFFTIGMVGVLFMLLVRDVLDDITGIAVSAPEFGYDFLAYYDAANRWLQTGSPYQAATLAGPFRAGPQGLYLYSPVPFIPFIPFTALSFHDGAVVFVVIQLLVVLGICLLMPVPMPVRLLTLAVATVSPALDQDLNLGNVSLIITFLGVIGWRYLDRPAGSAALAVAATIRPVMAIFAGWWLVRRRWRPLAWFIGAGLALFLASLPFVGLQGWFDYLTVLRNLTDFDHVFRNWALNGWAVRKGLPEPWPQVLLFGGYAIAGGAILLSLRRDRELSYVVTFGATLLLSPLLWDHYMTNLLVPTAFLLSRGHWYAFILPILPWLPQDQIPLWAILATVLPLLAPTKREPAPDAVDAQPAAEPTPASA